MNGEIIGVDEIVKSFDKISAKVGVRVMKNSARKALRPTVRKMQSMAPVGTKAHRTYKGRLVAPGFLKKSIRLIVQVKKNTGKVISVIGVRKEAFYGPQYYDQGPYHVKKRNRRTGVRKRAKNSIKPYTLHQHKFFKSVFIADRHNIELRFVEAMKSEVQKNVS